MVLRIVTKIGLSAMAIRVYAIEAGSVKSGTVLGLLGHERLGLPVSWEVEAFWGILVGGRANLVHSGIVYPECAWQ